MIADLTPYPSYKDSGLPWLGEIPEHWNVRRFKYILKEQDARSVDGSEQLLRVSQYTGVTERRRADGTDEPDTRAESLINYKCVVPGDLVVNIMLAWNGSLGASRYSGITSPAYCVYRLGSGANPWYFHHLLRSSAYKSRIKALSTGVIESRLRLYTDELYRLEALVPSLDEQCGIVQYLDYIDRRIRHYIRSKLKLVKLLEEQHQAIIDRAVTHGINPNVGLKPSDIEWLGDVPEHWKITRLRNIAEMRVSNVDKLSTDGERSIRLCNYVDVYKNDRIREDMPFMQATATTEEVKRFRLEPDDVLITKDSELWTDIGVPALVETSADDLICGYHLALLRPFKSQILGGFLFRALQSVSVSYQLHVEANGVTRYGLSQGAIKSISLPVPPLPEQADIVRYLDEATIAMARVVERLNRDVSLLLEYWTRLIADVVTGKVDVRNAAARLSNEISQEEMILDEMEPLAEDGLEDDDSGPGASLEEVEA